MMTKSGSRMITVVFALAGTYAVASGQPIENWPVPQLWIPALTVAPGEAAEELAPLEADAVEGVPTPSVPFVGIAPCRILDTRGNGAPIQGGIFTNGQARNYTLTGICGIPAGAQAASLNFTVTGSPSAPPGAFLLAYPQGGAVPPVSILNFQAGQTLANAAIVPLSGAGGITVNVSHSTHVIIDVNGYFGGGVVSALNGLTGNVTLAAGSNVTITPSGQTLTVASTGGPGGVLPTGTSGQTLRHNGSSWVASSALTNNGTDVALTGALVLPYPARILSSTAVYLHNRGAGNIFVGYEAATSDTPGLFNTGIGNVALLATTAGSENNVAVGAYALFHNTTGDGNIGIGFNALADVNTGSGNIAIGSAALGLTTGSNNLYIGNPGAGNESGQIRIGNNAVHTQGTVIASIFGFLSSSGIPVYVTSGGRLGTSTSSGRFKVDIRDIAAGSEGLMSLRPVAFRYTPELDPSGLRQYGLIAEEVAEIYPELVVYDEEGRPEAIRSQLLQPLFLNELQKQRRTIDAQRAELDELKEKLTRLESLMREGKD